MGFQPVYMALAENRCICFVWVFHIHRLWCQTGVYVLRRFFIYTGCGRFGAKLEKIIVNQSFCSGPSLEPWSECGFQGGAPAGKRLLVAEHSQRWATCGTRTAAQLLGKAIIPWLRLRLHTFALSAPVPSDASRNVARKNITDLSVDTATPKKSFYALPCIVHWRLAAPNKNTMANKQCQPTSAPRRNQNTIFFQISTPPVYMYIFSLPIAGHSPIVKNGSSTLQDSAGHLQNSLQDIHLL